MLETGWSYPELRALPEAYLPSLIEQLRQRSAARRRTARGGTPLPRRR